MESLDIAANYTKIMRVKVITTEFKNKAMQELNYCSC